MSRISRRPWGALLLLAVVIAGATIGWIGGTEILRLFPNL